MSIRFIAARGILTAALGCVMTGQAFSKDLSSSALPGYWVSRCFQFDDHEFQSRAFRFYPDGQLTILTRYFSDVECMRETDPSTLIPARWSSGASVVTEEGVTALSIQITLPVKEQLTRIQQVLFGTDTHFYLGISSGPDVLPSRLDWAIDYTRY